MKDLPQTETLARLWPEGPQAAACALDHEWRRAALLLSLAEAMRGGPSLPEGFEASFGAAQDAVMAAREAGSWRGLSALCDPATQAALNALDIDLLALALAPEARPALAPRLRALQPASGAAWPGLAMMQELLMLENGADLAALYARLGPDAPLIISGLARLERRGGELVLIPAARVARHLLARPADPAPPPGADAASPVSEGIDALVLAPATRARIGEFIAWILGRDQVFGAWGGRAIAGPIALFCGPSGVGKSHSVACIAGELALRSGESWGLYRLDLGRIISKYIGETEKNINALLDALAGRRAILQIDEADGILGKRGELRDARDRYANLEVSHLLSRLERHDGPVILTTNMRTNIDPAFLRRFQSVVDFPAPDMALRAALWSRLLPPGAPRDAALCTDLIGRALPLSGGAIHNAAITAAMLAHSEARPISLAHIARAAWRELGKEARTLRRTELGELATYLPEEET